ncbi:solute carrier organic anion transporter family member 2B1-like [Bicyclus anynana]|uniref:Solute carrier organic anion transporter family member 2B1-like n=1 Tax=Bicyclus anynana TaxID=110368 RepID=A0ABM3LZ02_BICAN|nr:solute carrier organic anion transporter family member 2B1-like [Bicyclus anynana]
MVTYVSPCHAGCGGEELFDGVRAYTNCTCSSTGRAVLGACSDVPCKQAHAQHGMLLVIAVTFTLLCFQAQGVMLLRIVDPRDKSVVMGVAWFVVTLMTFVCGNLLFMAMRLGMCRWYEGDQCHLQTSNFSNHVGATCAAIAIASLIISIISAFSLRKKNKSSHDTRL